MNKRAGYAVIIGKPNVGKSTLLNVILGTKLSIVTSKAQTTRKHVIGIYTTNDTQIIFYDTPGLINPVYELHRSMMNIAYKSIKDSDVIIAILDISDYKSEKHFLNKEFIELIQKYRKPVICALNKLDLLENESDIFAATKKLEDLKIFTSVVPISALQKRNIENLVAEISKYLPQSAFLYDSDYLSTQPERFFVSEIIREQIFLLFEQEIPYSTEVQVMEFKERETGKWYISAEIIVEKSSQKAIIIGKKGTKLKFLGEQCRILIEKYLQKQVYLELFVKWRKNWRKNKMILKNLGY
jgi:GTP-binding protein Era